jgi:hypothetical protein
MAVIYEAAVLTTGGTFRAYNIAETVICVTEDGTEGITDFIHHAIHDTALGAPEMLIPLLTDWIYEMRRGVDVITASLTSRSE